MGSREGFRMIYGSEVFARGVKIGCYVCYFRVSWGRLKKRNGGGGG